MSKSHECPFTHTKRNNLIRYNPPNHRVAACFLLHDLLMLLQEAANGGNEADWNHALSRMKLAVTACKTPQHEPNPKEANP